MPPSRSLSDSEAKEPIVVAVFNQKGGIGKTTTSTNMAVCMAAMGLKVGVIDLDTQGNATSSLGLVPAPAKGANDLLFGQDPVSELFLPTLFPQLLACGANDLLTTAEIRLSMVRNPHDTLRRRLARAKLALDVVVIDCPPAFGMLPLNALAASSRALMPVTAEPLAHHGVQKAWTNIRRIGASLNQRLGKPEVLLTMTGDSKAGAELAHTIHSEFGNQVFRTEIPRDTRVIEAAAADMPVSVYDPLCPSARAYLRLTIEFLSRLRRRQGALEDARGRTLDEGGGGRRPAWADYDAVHEVLRTWNSKLRPALAPQRGWSDPDDGPGASEDDGALVDPAAARRRRKAAGPDRKRKKLGAKGTVTQDAAAAPGQIPEDWVRETS